jgi:rod shape-determining protein MreD
MTAVRQVFIACSIYLTIALQSSAVWGELPQNCRPYLPALTLVAVGLGSEGATAIVWSACLGLLLDGLSLERLGVQMSLAAGIGWGLQVVKANSRPRAAISVTAIVIVVALLWRVASALVHSILSGRVVDPLAVLAMAVIEASVTAGFAGLFVCGAVLLLRGSIARGHSDRSHRVLF